MLDHHIHSNSRRSWILNWFSQLTSSPTSTIDSSQQSRQSSSEVLSQPTSSASSIENVKQPAISITTHVPGKGQQRDSVCFEEDLDDDDQFSSKSAHRRDSKERSILGDLWSRARRHYPHYPRFHWPHHHHHKKHHLHKNKNNSETMLPHSLSRLSIASSRRRSSSQNEDSLTIGDAQRLSSSFQEHSYISAPTSRPISVYSQPLTSRPVSIYSQTLDDNDEEDHTQWMEAEPPWAISPELVKMVMDNDLFCSPLHDIGVEKHVLHVGPGDWAIDVATAYPRWRVTDLLAMDQQQPSNAHRRRRHNLKTVRCPNLVDGGLSNMADHSFDIIRCQFLNLSITSQEYKELLQEVWRVCAPGGFIELVELDMRIYYDQPGGATLAKITQQFNSEVIHVMEAKSLDPRLARQLKDALSNQNDTTYHGLTNGRYASLPLGVWGGRIGILFRDDIHDLFERFQVAVAEHNQIAERTDLELESAFDEMDQEMGQYRAFMNLHYVWSQKVERPLITP